jgi:hypothetical protein
MRFLIVLLLAGCVSISEEAKQVRVTSVPSVVEDCIYIGNISAMSGWAGFMEGVAESNSLKALKRETSEMGGDTLFLIENSIHSVGEAYNCGGNDG